jgi:hypothetical protein
VLEAIVELLKSRHLNAITFDPLQEYVRGRCPPLYLRYYTFNNLYRNLDTHMRWYAISRYDPMIIKRLDYEYHEDFAITFPVS